MKSYSIRFAFAFLALASMSLSALAQGKAFDTTRMDTGVEACDDFFSYANGTWVKNAEIPPSQSRWGTFNILQDSNTAKLHDILETAAKSNAPKGSDMQIIGDLYASCMDESAIETAGAAPIQLHLKRIENIRDLKSLQKAVADFHNQGVGMFFGFFGGSDAKNSNLTIANARQGGLSLPNRNYYTETDEKSVKLRDQFVEYMTNMFKLIGEDADKAAKDAATVMSIQTRLANASKKPSELRKPEENYNKKSLSDLAQFNPNFSWVNYMKMRGVPPVNEVNLGQPDFFRELDKMMSDVPLSDLKTYMRWMVLNDSASSLSKKFDDERFNFFSRILQGTKEQQPRWKRCVGVVNGTLGESLGSEYIKTNFTPEARKRVNELIDNLFSAYQVRINQVDWMTDDTKKQALRKLSLYKRKIGSPDKLRGYAGLTIDRKSYFANGERAGKFLTVRNLNDIGKPVDKTRWGFTAPTVNAQYSPSFNDITFPAGILQPPFFNFAADDAINYGAIGAVIGHEITHGFDDQGSQYDADGNLKSWWTKDDRSKFETKASCVVNQFKGYEIQPNLFIDGNLTLGENLADLGGLTMAFAAYQKSLDGKSRPENIDGFTAEQRFFLGYAQVWATKSTPEFERSQVKTDPHSNARYRVNGPLSNLPQFANAFGCKTGNKMVRSEICGIW